MVKTIPFNSLYLDAGAWIALTNKKDRYHSIATEFYRAIPKTVKLFTGYLVISESYTWLRYCIGINVALKFLESTEKAIIGKSLEVLYPNELIDQKARQILYNYTDQKLSYCDATSFAICNLLKIKDILGFDSHLYISGKAVWPRIK